MRALLSAPRRLSFGPYEADLYSGELLKYGNKVRLQAQPFQLLVMLLERPGELVTREQICAKLWPADTYVDFDRSLGTALNKIREVLNDSAAEPRFVETLHRRGYRFIAPVTPVDPDPAPAPSLPPVSTLPPAATEANAKPKLHTIRLIGLSAAVLLVIAALGGWIMLDRREQSTSKPASPSVIRSIAVLPLLNLSGDPDQQFFADGMTDELITSLAQISSLRVISRTSAMAYLGTHKSAPQIARELGVDALVEGSVVRSGSNVRITAQLIQGASDRHLWAQSYERQLSDILTVQGAVAQEIAARVSLQLTPNERAQLSRSNPVNPEVALLIFKGSYLLAKMEPERAKDYFSQATQMDPNSAEAWAGLADSLHTMAVEGDYEAFAQAKTAANKALEIDGSQAQALMVLGVVSFLKDWNPEASEAFFRRSLAARPGFATAHALFATTLVHHGKFAEAIEQINWASSSDPVSVLAHSQAWHVYFSARRYDEALRIILDTVELDPKFPPAYWRLATSWEQKGEYHKAIETFRESGRIGPEAAHEGQESAALGDAFAAGGVPAYWQRKLETLLKEQRPQERYGFSGIARCYMRLGKPEQALKTLELGYRRHDPYLIFWLPIYEEFDPLRAEPRFQKMLHGLGME
jgi:TolB-like protein/DNA-binding winged helix-turn-helix (wHTH) protein/Tfp pilus assembly protein PilF